MRKNIIVTGMPRSGKSTLLNKVILSYPNKVGFVTNEVRENGERVGFEIVTSTGKKAMLASVNFLTEYKVSRYFVDINNLELVIPEILQFKEGDLLYLDEIGQMELYSEKFKKATNLILNSPNICLVTLSKIYSDDFIENIKKRKDIILIELTENNRELNQKFVEDLIGKIIKAKKYINEPRRFKIELEKATIDAEHGTRNLIKRDNQWLCDCDFFTQKKICSHVIALEELYKLQT